MVSSRCVNLRHKLFGVVLVEVASIAVEVVGQDDECRCLVDVVFVACDPEVHKKLQDRRWVLAVEVSY